MNSKRIQLLLTGVATCITLTFFMTPTYGLSIVIGGNYTEIGTIIFVSPKPGDTPAAAGTALLNLVNGITDNSADNPYLIKIGPGLYDLGAGSLEMKENVDIEGSGETTTIIMGHIDSIIAGVVQGANNAEIRFLTVQNAGGATNALAISNTSASPKLTNVTAFASGGTVSYGVRNAGSSSPTMTNLTVSASGGGTNVGVYNFSSSPTMTNVTASASGGTSSYGVFNLSSSPTMTNVTASGSGATGTNCGVRNDTSSPTMTNVTASGSGGTSNYGFYNVGAGTIRINHSVIKGTGQTIRNITPATTLVGNSQLDGGSVFNSGTLTCVGAYDENYVALNTSCQ